MNKVSMYRAFSTKRAKVCEGKGGRRPQRPFNLLDRSRVKVTRLLDKESEGKKSILRLVRGTDDPYIPPPSLTQR